MITHWHYDHTFGMCAINGISIAYEKTNEFLKDQQEQAKVQIILRPSNRKMFILGKSTADVIG